MKTVTVESLVKSAASLAGLDGSAIANIPVTTRTIMVEHAKDHLKVGWERFDWPDLTRVELRTVQEDSYGGLYLDVEQSGETAMGEVFSVMLDNPHTHASPRLLVYWLENGKVRLPLQTPATVWVRFRLQPQELPGDLTAALASTVPAVLGDHIKFSLVGDLHTEDGQVDKGLVFYQRADDSLIREQDKIVFQQHQPRRWSAVVGG